MESTISVSKGVFVFKNGFKSGSKRKTKSKKKKIENENIFANTLWYQSYSTLWNFLEGKIQHLNDEMFSNILSNLISYVKNCYSDTVTEVPTAALMTGINMPDHAAQFSALAKNIKAEVSPHVVYLQSQDCQNLKYLVENMVNQLVSHGETDSDSDEDLESGNKPVKIRKSQANFALLQAWYESLDNSSPNKDKKNKQHKDVIVVIVPDFEAFNETVLQKFILIASNYINVLPFVLVFGVATSLTVLHRTLPYHVSSKINVTVFNSQPSTLYLNNVVEHVFFSDECPFHLGGKVFTLLVDIFLFYDFSVTGFISNFKYAMLEHFSYGNTMALCCDVNKLDDILKNFTAEDFDNTRRFMSFRKLVASETDENKIKLLTDDEYFKTRLKHEIKTTRKSIEYFHLFLRLLHVLVCDLPKTPLGKQVRELYSLAGKTNITKTKEYIECFQLLNFQAWDELSIKISKMTDVLSQTLENEFDRRKEIQDILNKLNLFLNNMNTVSSNGNEEIEKEDQENVITANMDRKQLKEKLLALSKQNKPVSLYEKTRATLLKFLEDIFAKYVIVPHELYFNEIFFFYDMSIHNHIIGSHRAAIHNALSDPHYYLQCNCCEIPDDTRILPQMPDISIVYKLHLECGKMINLYDWLQAFLSIVDPKEYDDESKRIVQPELQARFTQAVAEMEFLGFIKSSKRKVDHVARLTWGG